MPVTITFNLRLPKIRHRFSACHNNVPLGFVPEASMHKETINIRHTLMPLFGSHLSTIIQKYMKTSIFPKSYDFFRV